MELSNVKNNNYINFYSDDGTIQGAMDAIVKVKKQIAHDKKMIAYARKKYKPILDIYDEMKKIERKAYLYEHENYSEYRAEFEKYRELTRRLKDGYNKEIFEVSDFIQECDERILYAHAQLNELSREYRELKIYGQKHGYIQPGNTLTDLVGFYLNKEKEKMGVFISESYYIASANSSLIVHVTKSPTVDQYGNIIEEYQLSICDRNGNELESISNKNNTHEFVQRLKQLQDDMNLQECKRCDNFQLAKELAGINILKAEQKAEEHVQHLQSEKTNTSSGAAGEKIRVSSFSQAINHVWDEQKTNVITDELDPSFILLSTREEDRLKLVVMDKNNKIYESVYLPLVSNRNNDGYQTIVYIQKKYGFSDHTREYANIDEAKRSISENKNTASYHQRK